MFEWLQKLGDIHHGTFLPSCIGRASGGVERNAQLLLVPTWVCLLQEEGPDVLARLIDITQKVLISANRCQAIPKPLMVSEEI